MGDKFKLKSNFFITSDGVKLRYLKSQEKKSKCWLVFVHGAGGDATAWRKEMQIMSRAGYPSVAIDLRGHGLSDDPAELASYGFERMAQDIVELVAKLKIESLVLIGHCFGGMISIVLAGKQPHFIKGVVLIDTSYRPSLFGVVSSDHPRLANTLRRLAYVFPQGIQRVHEPYDRYVNTADFDIARLFADIRDTSLRSYLFCYSNVCEYDATSLLEKIRVPTLVICGEEDRIFPPEVSRNLASRIHGANLAIISDANHILVISKPKDLAETIISFVRRIKK